MFLAVAPEAFSMRDTASSLSFSNSAKKVKNDPVQNIKALDTDGTPRATPTRPKEEGCTSERVSQWDGWHRAYLHVHFKSRLLALLLVFSFYNFVKPVKPLVLTPIRNVRILERFAKGNCEDKKARLKEARSIDVRRKIWEQLREEKESTEQFELGCPLWNLDSLWSCFTHWQENGNPGAKNWWITLVIALASWNFVKYLEKSIFSRTP